MISKQIKNSIISTLVVCGLLLTSSQTLMAAKPVRLAPIAIDAVVVNFIDGEITVTGSGLEAVTGDATLGGINISVDILTQSTNSLVFQFSTSTAIAVTEPGNYSLALNGNTFSVYFSSNVVDPVTVSCPCEGFWTSRGSTEPVADPAISGYAGLAPYCAFQSGSGDQVAVQIFNEDNGQLWILTSEFTDTHECALVIDEPTETLNSPQEHALCASYLIDEYITPYQPLLDCGSFPIF